MSQNKSGTFRVELPIEFKGILEDLGQLTGTSRPRDTVICSISNLVWILDKMKDGHRILADKENHCVELDAPYLAKARAEGTKNRERRLVSAIS